MKITSGLWLARYWIAASALSALSTPISYFSRMRARNRRADLESSTINARFAAMPPPDGRLLESVTQNGWPAIAVARWRRSRSGDGACRAWGNSDDAVELSESPCHRGGGPCACVRAPVLGKLCLQASILQDARDGRGEGVCALLDDQRAAAGRENRARAELGGRDNRRALRHRFEQHEPLSLGAGCEHEHVRCGITIEQCRVAIEVACEVHVTF